MPRLVGLGGGGGGLVEGMSGMLYIVSGSLQAGYAVYTYSCCFHVGVLWAGAGSFQRAPFGAGDVGDARTVSW